jgi:hypothetical protein
MTAIKGDLVISNRLCEALAGELLLNCSCNLDRMLDAERRRVRWSTLVRSFLIVSSYTLNITKKV